ncbi:beta-galactosidase [Cohnella lupini]|uniref:Beta-galactosidase n=1 Tax=Cohnella lupini TaxID=1294267 RepID=A0A3D9IS89_9BACL|nr:alpha-amylase family protein [Cohnella lupini]RED64622.1 beta-galactosidase [Cohnella lupini]
MKVSSRLIRHLKLTKRSYGGVSTGVINGKRVGAMKLGVAYYPEHNKREHWGRDLEQMKGAGIERVRIAEFAWSRMEPDNGAFEWAWLDEFMALSMEYGMEVILCTPTACPPIWLVEQHPDVLPVNDEGRRNVFGARQHRCYNSPSYLKYSLRIVEEMAARYGKHPNAVAWQIDNEFGGEQKRCYCDHCRAAFQSAMEAKYESIGELNERWGNVFWSMEYQTFAQIKTPMKYTADLSLKNNPSLEMEYWRFCSDAIVSYCSEQARHIRKHNDGAKRPITTNRFSLIWGDNVRWPDLMRDMDVAGIDLYSEKLHEIAFYADSNYSLKPGASWFIEYGPGVNNLRDGMLQLQGRGCDWMTIFKFKPFPFGQEQGLQELVTLTGEPTDSYRVLEQWSAGPNMVEESRDAMFAPSGVGMYYHFESSWAYTISLWGAQIHHRLHYPNYVIDTVYKSLYRENKAHRIVFSPDNLEGLHTLVVPLQIVHEPALEDALLRFAEKGGRLVVTTDLFQKNAENVYLNDISRFYVEVFGLSSFIAKPLSEEPVQIRRSYGKGQVLLVKKDATLAEWESVVNELNL